MVDRIQSQMPDDWHEKSRTDSQKPKPLDSDQYRRVEKDKGRPPSKEEVEQKNVSEKENRSVFDLSKEKPKRKTSSDGKLKGKEELGGEGDVKGSALGTVKRQPPKMEQEPEFTDITETPVYADDFPPTEEAPAQKSTPLQGQESAPKLPAMKQPLETRTPPPADMSQVVVPKKGDKASGIETKKEEPVSKKDKSKGEAQAASESGEKGVIAAGQTSMQAVAFQTEKAEIAQETSRSATIADLATQIVDKIQVMRKDDLTSTIITLRHPPVLDGATITLTTSDNAKREFNISFANLTPDAKQFLDRQLQANSLTDNLEKKGIIVHQLTTTTEPEKIMTADAGQASQDRRDQEQDQEQRRQRQQQGSEEEET